jgi:hypothetical protein
VDILKIDQSFVQSMLVDPQDFTIVDSVVRLSQAFQHPVIAEGVESIQHASALLQLGCRLGQGYGIARPMPAAQLPTWLEQWKNDINWQGLKNRLFQNDEMSLGVAIASHRKWVENIIGYIEQNKPLNRNQLDSKHCRFNYWLHGLGFVQYGDMQQYVTINRLHEEIHAQGNKLVSLKSKGSMELARKGLKDLNTMSNHFVVLLKGLDSAKEDVI